MYELLDEVDDDTEEVCDSAADSAVMEDEDVCTDSNVISKITG